MNQSVFIPEQFTEVKHSAPMGVWQKRLSILLAAQMVLIASLWGWQYSQQQPVKPQSLLTQDLSSLDKLTIADAQNSVTLQKTAGSWQLPNLQQLPADNTRIDELVKKLINAQLTLPVTTSPNSHPRFDVSADKFQRKITLFQGDKTVAEIFLGTSPSFKKVHVRKQGDNLVYAINMQAFDWDTSANAWLKKDLLALKDITAVSTSNYSLKKTADGWSLDGANNADKNKAEELTNSLAQLKVQEAAQTLPKGETHNLAITTASGQHQYTLVKAENQYWLKRDDNAAVFKISQADFERITQVSKTDLTAKPAAPTTADPVNQLLKQSTQGIFVSPPKGQ